MAERYRPGLLATDMGFDGGPIFDVTDRGIAIVVDGRLLGYTSADELRAIVKAADEQCPSCGRPKTSWQQQLAEQQRRAPFLTS